METRVSFPGDGFHLEGRLARASLSNAVVVAHPHPLYGGDMDNPVVEAVIRAYARRGYSTLRFNFRGVGKSGGAFDDGNGEESDIRAAIDFLQCAGIRVTDLAGYSFGAWVLARLSPLPKPVHRMLMVAPPVAFMDFSDVSPPPLDLRIFVGSLDTFAPPKDVADWIFPLACRPTVLQGMDHFFSGGLDELETAVWQEIPPASP